MEKKYEVNGVKTNYFSQMFLQCHGSMSPKTELSIVTKAVEQVQKGYYDESEQWEAHMEAKSILSQELAEQGSIDIPTVAEKIFHEKPELDGFAVPGSSICRTRRYDHGGFVSVFSNGRRIL